MMNIRLTLERFCTTCNKMLWYVLAAVMAFEFLFLCLLVVLRYVFNTTIVGGQELIDYLFIYLSALGAALLIQTDEHINVDFFVNASDKVKKVLHLVQYVTLFFLHLFLTVLSIQWIGKVGSFPTPVLHWSQGVFQMAIPISMSIGLIICITKFLLTILNDRPFQREN